MRKPLACPPFPLRDWLQPGDALLYQGQGWFSKVIRVKTWSDVSHVEVYMGEGIAYASRDGVGVRSYPVRGTDLFAVLRPEWEFDATQATAWHNTVAGQAYDWWGLLRFFTIGQQSMDKQFCFEYATRLYRAAGGDPFAHDYDADLVSGNMFLASPHFRRVWTAV